MFYFFSIVVYNNKCDVKKIIQLKKDKYEVY